MSTKKLGQVGAIYIGASAPVNTNIIWRDTSANPYSWKTFNAQSELWEPFNDVSRSRQTLSVSVGDIINLDWNDLNELMGLNRLDISSNASVAYSNIDNAEFATIKMEISNLSTVTFPEGSISPDFDENRTWTPPTNGKFTFSIYKTSTEYEVIFTQNAAA